MWMACVLFQAPPFHIKGMIFAYHEWIVGWFATGHLEIISLLVAVINVLES